MASARSFQRRRGSELPQLEHNTADDDPVGSACCGGRIGGSSRGAKVRVDSVRVIPNAVDVECFRPTDVHYTGKPILLWVGRSDDVQQKDLPGFLRVLRRNPSYRGVIVDADHRPESVDGHDVDYRSQLGPEEMAIVYNTARRSGGALVSTSRFEGMANNVLEAAACGCPIIAPNVPGMEHLRDGETALLYERKDDLVAIDDELRRLPQLRDDLSHNGRRYVVEHHRIDTRAERYAAAYDDARAAARTQHTRDSDVVARRAWAVALRARRRGRVSRSPSVEPLTRRRTRAGARARERRGESQTTPQAA